ncbi:hypothetical protein [Variovorax sp. LjRoot84]
MTRVEGRTAIAGREARAGRSLERHLRLGAMLVIHANPAVAST